MFPELQRVHTAIKDAICAFIRITTNQEFHEDELRDFVAAYVGGPVAPSSPSRVLRHLRHTGEVSYDLVSRRKSLYRSNGVVTREENDLQT